MRLLLDTHAFLWFLAGDPSLSSAARAAMEETENELLLSVASLWEMAIKVSIGKLSLPGDYESFITSQLAANDIHLLDITPQHAAMVSALPFPTNGHRDPFDRLLIAQARVENIPLVSQDGALDHYAVMRIG
jgi:PIN domain nuclease of toxin-antitoxin system